MLGLAALGTCQPHEHTQWLREDLGVGAAVVTSHPAPTMTKGVCPLLEDAEGTIQLQVRCRVPLSGTALSTSQGWDCFLGGH